MTNLYDMTSRPQVVSILGGTEDKHTWRSIEKANDNLKLCQMAVILVHQSLHIVKGHYYP